MFIRTYASSRVKRKSFYRKSELQMFLLISGGHVGVPTTVQQYGVSMKRSQNKVYFLQLIPQLGLKFDP